MTPRIWARARKSVSASDASGPGSSVRARQKAARSRSPVARIGAALDGAVPLQPVGEDAQVGNAAYLRNPSITK